MEHTFNSIQLIQNSIEKKLYLKMVTQLVHTTCIHN